MRVEGLDHVNLRVKDPERSLAFYRDVLGLEPERLEEFRRGETSLLTLRVNERAIVHLRPDDGFEPPPAEELSSAFDHVALNVAGSMEDVLAELARHGIAVEQEPFDAYGALGVGPAIYIRDPDGYRVELKARR